MNNSKPKPSNPDSYSDYFLLNDYLTPSHPKHLISYPKTLSHQRKTSQVSTLSCKSKIRNSSLNDHQTTLNKQLSHNTVSTDTKTRKTKLNQHSIKKELSIDKHKIPTNKHHLSLRKQKLKIDTDRKTKPKTTQNLTSRYLHFDSVKPIFKITPKNHITSHSSIGNKCDHTDMKVKSVKNKQDHEKTLIPKFKLREKNLELMVSRCSNVMTEYYERLNLLKKENEELRYQNEELKRIQLGFI